MPGHPPDTEPGPHGSSTPSGGWRITHKNQSGPFDHRTPISEQMLLTIMQEISRDAVLAIDPEGRITWWNQGAEALLGYSEEEVLGKHFEFMIPDDLKSMGEAERLLEETEPLGFLRDYETRRLTQDGREIHVSLIRMRHLDPDGRLLGAIAILRDITESKKMADALVRSQTLAAIGEFAARIAHEVKNPLTGISSALSLITHEAEARDPHRDLYDEIQDQIRRIDHTLDDLLTFARQRTPDRQRMDLVQLVRKVLTIVGASGELKGIELGLDFPDEAIVSGDPSMVQDCYFNLIHNAAQALQQEGGGRLDLSITARSDGFLSLIKDDGAGIPAELREKVFDPFYTTKTRGTGLGLPITAKHAEAQGGRLRLRAGDERGTTFELFLPSDEISASFRQSPGSDAT